MSWVVFIEKANEFNIKSENFEKLFEFGEFKPELISFLESTNSFGAVEGSADRESYNLKVIGFKKAFSSSQKILDRERSFIFGVKLVEKISSLLIF